MVDIEVGRVRMYFLAENGIKMGARRLGYAKYNFLAKRCRFGLSRAKTALFYP